MDKVKLLIILYIIVGVVTSLLGFLTLILINNGIILRDNIIIRYLLLAFAGVTILVGVHIALAGISSLRGK
ncbi:MAG: hypothetical protein QXT01_04975 [Sulfolobales archaeon]